jgi:hypothetical protein
MSWSLNRRGNVRSAKAPAGAAPPLHVLLAREQDGRTFSVKRKENGAFVVNGTTARTVERLEMIKNCHQCEGVLRVWEIKCPYCHQSAMSWLHITVIVVLAAPVVFYMLNLI